MAKAFLPSMFTPRSVVATAPATHPGQPRLPVEPGQAEQPSSDPAPIPLTYLSSQSNPGKPETPRGKGSAVQIR